MPLIPFSGGETDAYGMCQTPKVNQCKSMIQHIDFRSKRQSFAVTIRHLLYEIFKLVGTDKNPSPFNLVVWIHHGHNLNQCMLLNNWRRGIRSTEVLTDVLSPK